MTVKELLKKLENSGASINDEIQIIGPAYNGYTSTNGRYDVAGISKMGNWPVIIYIK